MQSQQAGGPPLPSSARRGPVTPVLGRRLRFGDALYNEAHDFLIEEAYFLDEDQFTDWLALLAEDILYSMPVRQTVYRQGGKGFAPAMNWFYEDLDSLKFKVSRLQSDSAFAEDPPSRVRRLVTNLRLHETTTEGEFLAQNYVLLRRNRGDAHVSDTISARRDDILRRSGDGWKLAQRTILMDQAVLGTPNLAIFL